jgi:hypothetical protein
VVSLGLWIAIGLIAILYAVKSWIMRYCMVAVQMRKISIQESAKMTGVFFNLLEGLSVIRCTRAFSENLPKG